jgi:hypothetical protein
MRALFLALAFVACSTAGETKIPGDTDATQDTDVVDTDVIAEDTDVVVEDTDTVTPPEDTDVPAGACDNPADFAALAAAADTISDTTQSCVFSCTQAPRLGACVTTCIGADVGLTGGCAQCFGNISVCVVNQCLTQCLDASSAACENCRKQKCEPAFVTCAGITPP